MLDDVEDDWMTAFRRARAPRNLELVDRARASVAAGKDRWWTAALVLQPLVVVALAVVCWQVRSTSLAVSIVVAAGALLVGGFLVAFATRAWGARRLHPLAPLERPARRSIQRQVSGRTVLDPGTQPVCDVVAAGDYRRGVMAVIWTGMALVQLTTAAATDDTVGRVLLTTSAVLGATGAWLILLQAVQAARYFRRTAQPAPASS